MPQLYFEFYTEHQKRHQVLHGYLDELLADFIISTKKRLSSASVLELTRWSNEQTMPAHKRERIIRYKPSAENSDYWEVDGFEDEDE